MWEIRWHAFFRYVGRTPSAALRHDDPGRAGGPFPPYAAARIAMEVLITHRQYPPLENGLR